jgi:hypothetical protein
VVGALGAEPVGGREALVEPAEVGEPAKRGQLVDHHLGLGPGEGVEHGVAVQGVEDHAVAPAAPSASALLGVRVVPTTVWPLAASRGTSRRPRAPVAPATKIFMASSLVLVS